MQENECRGETVPSLRFRALLTESDDRGVQLHWV
jgi:hypothetical protein